MKKSAILLYKNEKIDSCKLDDLQDEINKNVQYILLPIFENRASQLFLGLNPEHTITHFGSAKIRYRLGVEFFSDDTVEPYRSEELEFHPSDVQELYEVLHNIEVLRFIYMIMNNTPETYGEYSFVDIYEIHIDIKKSNFGHIQFDWCAPYGDDGLTSNRYLHVDYILRHIKSFYDTINQTLGHNERIHLLNDRWECTRAINDDGLYGMKSAAGSIIMISESAYKFVKRIFGKRERQRHFVNFIVYEKSSATFGDYEVSMKLYKKYYYHVNEADVFYDYLSYVYSVEDIFNIILYMDQIRDAMRFCEHIIDHSTISRQTGGQLNEKKIFILTVFTFMIRDGSYGRTTYGQFPAEDDYFIELCVANDRLSDNTMIDELMMDFKRQFKERKLRFNEED